MIIKDLIDVEKMSYNWDYIDTIPEFNALKSCEQSPKWHSEGNAWKHTQMVCSEAVMICKAKLSSERERKILLAAALFHDIGKPNVTKRSEKDGMWHSYQHEDVGEKITRLMLWDEAYEDREEVCALVKYHMAPLTLFDSKHFYEKLINLAYNVNMKLLIELKMCDVQGSIPDEKYDKQIDFCKLEDLKHICHNIGCYGTIPLIPIGKNDFMYQVYKRCKSQMREVYVLIGLPGAGKSTVIEEIANGQEYVVVSRDIIRAELGYCKKGDKMVGTPEQEANVTIEFNKQLCNGVISDKIVFIDNINLKRKYRDAYHEFLKELDKTYNIVWRYVYVESASLSTNIERRKNDGIGEKLFKDMIRSIDWPTFDEYDSMYFVTT